ncbi:MAG TPA: nitroreductase [Casimicrobiaceae bacterium]|nr:nitroreductase [Casimicrobiaceae bacterium]
MDAIEALTTRVSGVALVGPAPDELELHTILSAALRAPDHGRLRPWRFIVVRGAARNRLGELMGEALRRRHPDATPAQVDKERNRPLRAPLILVVAAKVDEGSHIPAIEQVLSAGAAAQNVMIAAFALGFGCAWKTGEAAYDLDIKAAFDLAPADAIVGFLYVGSNASPPPPPAKPDPSDHVVEWSDRTS